jgi:NTP-dependent ternary system trypsin peptidase co-occuring protein
MSFEQDQAQYIPVELANGRTIKIEVSHTGLEDVGFNTFSFKQVSEALEGIVESLKNTLDKVKPDKATVKFGVEMAVESGGLTAMIVKGTGKGNLEITLEWIK